MQEQNNSEPQTNPTVPEATPPPPLDIEPIVSPRPKRKKLMIIFAVVVLIAAAVGGYFYWNSTKDKTGEKKSTQTTTPMVEVKAELLETPKKLTTDLKFFKNPEDYFGQECAQGSTVCDIPLVKASDIVYYELGKTSEGRALFAAYVELGIDTTTYIAVEKAPGEYTILGLFTYYEAIKNSTGFIDDFKAALSSNVELDTVTTIPELMFPTSAKIKNDSYKPLYTGGLGSGYFLAKGLDHLDPRTSAAGPTPEKVGSVDGYTLYKVVTKDPSGLFDSVVLYMTVNELFAMQYTPDDHLQTSSQDVAAEVAAPEMSWKTGETTKAYYVSKPIGCGTVTYLIANNFKKGDLTVIGTGPDKQVLYELPSSSALFQKIFKEDYMDDFIEDKSLVNLTPEQFQAKHGMFLAENSSGEMVLYLRSDMFVGGGCGKPVIYLYPSATTSVNVGVGADVVKSDPLYPTGGWRNVVATPTGQLTYQGKQYDSLYWEGFGHGMYPAITEGTVVARDQVVPTIRHQLTQQGFNNKETNDFLAFWQSKLPTAPYTRLTWFTTAQLDALAPLSIAPQPKTVIRAFLDFQGLDKPTTLPAQTFATPKRTGFTVVEWGGLLRDGSISR